MFFFAPAAAPAGAGPCAGPFSQWRRASGGWDGPLREISGWDTPREMEGGVLKIYDFDGAKNVSGDCIHRARTAMRLSQADLAARMQVNGVTIEREAISKIETGDRFVTDYELMVFAKVLGVSMDWLVKADSGSQ